MIAEPDILCSVRWQYLIVDEGHRLKGRDSKILEVMNELRARRKLVLTGTPLQSQRCRV